MVQSLLRHGPERGFFFFFSENIVPAAAGPAGPAPAPLYCLSICCPGNIPDKYGVVKDL